MKLSRTTAYAVSALLQLSDSPPGKPVSSHRLAVQGALPERFLLQVLRSLVNYGLLTSTRGVVGGYSLALPLSEISLLNVVEAAEGPITPVFPAVDAVPETVRTRLTAALEDATAGTAKFLAATSMEDLKSPLKKKGSPGLTEGFQQIR